MSLDDALRQRGFRRWYERQLIESHAWLITAFLALIMLAIALEAVEFDGPFGNALALILIALAGGWLVVHALQRFQRLMTRAEALASQAVCAQCRSYGRFEVLQARDAPDAISGRSVEVRCRGCAHQWRMG